VISLPPSARFISLYTFERWQEGGRKEKLAGKGGEGIVHLGRREGMQGKNVHGRNITEVGIRRVQQGGGGEKRGRRWWRRRVITREDRSHTPC
jgi:hypothetical protein